MPEYVREKLTLNFPLVTEYLVKRIKDYINNSGKSGGIIGLSGGIDSSVASVLLSKATENFHVLLMPSSSTPKEDLDHAFMILRLINATESKYTIINIDPIVDQFRLAVKTNDKIISGNIKARSRMILLYAFAQKFNYLVVGTGDKSELMLGYFTKYGDGGVDILPLGDLYKTQVRMLGRYLGVPEDIVKKPPSPALWEGQTAEGEIGLDYETIDSILYLRFEEMRSENEISALVNVPIDLVRRIVRMVKISQHKRLPPEIFRLSGRSINSDWRYPRQWA
ncbi:NAD+ synthase [Sulfolobus acidocaldarius]|uniref:NH(3)-dependent NAD(+) synthetase n=4 Tax=Sulfolobus acidocaldarius TaxID=2285 RepID=NADE_SULAC|nr:NAD+ synthase [Sulfolobus acidocaldarius]Q4JCP0.1 RecName: Full=NH(3)-dependent NAD(+) synthetase [Sulfolobus acidocaldarius DSM 639]AAY79439.1 NH(3)-dependent NAD(+) synthetase [Sulfolobus acidocaldarius DSM 639]AGE72265.1 NAD synthetase [Sulfolobus acidocaldarius Ron12/I]ALU30592.1 NAD(+) synthetase [Sulfolobus acidocaldarius]ALU32853.1 NAD(+) synthetase [Sulfolobus acidocaldarius]WCM35968.1 NAD+ synthase [Sulfolobus acidocaldarius DSM 639]